MTLAYATRRPTATRADKLLASGLGAVVKFTHVRVMRVLLLLLLLALPLLAHAAERDKPADLVPPLLAQTPDPSEVDKFYPALPQGLEIEGSALVRCTVTAAGAGRDCHAVSDSPPGLGFGPAGAKLAETFHFKPGTLRGVPREATWTSRIKFALDNDDTQIEQPPPNAPDPRPSPGMIYLAKQYLAAAGPDIAGAGVESDVENTRTACAKEGGTYCDQLVKAVRDAEVETAQALREDLAAQVASIYTADELKALVAFADSPAGRAMREKGPKLGAAMSGLAVQANHKAIRAVRDRYCAAVGCITVTAVKDESDAAQAKPQ